MANLKRPRGLSGLHPTRSGRMQAVTPSAFAALKHLAIFTQTLYWCFTFLSVDIIGSKFLRRLGLSLRQPKAHDGSIL